MTIIKRDRCGYRAKVKACFWYLVSPRFATIANSRNDHPSVNHDNSSDNSETVLRV